MVDYNSVLLMCNSVEEVKVLIQDLALFVVNKETSLCVVSDCNSPQCFNSEYCVKHKRLLL